MKSFISLFFMLNMLAAIAGERGTLKSELSFEITKRSTVQSLPKDSVEFEFTFKTSDGGKLKTIQFGTTSDVTEYLIPDKTGKYKKRLPAGKHVLYFYQYEYFEVITDTIEVASKEKIFAKVNLQKADMIITVDKPVIYLYPEKEMQVSVGIEGGGELGFTYPTYQEGWNFTATPAGKLEFETGTFNYLFYESDVKAKSLTSGKNDGFRVDTDNLLAFLESSLEKMGFTAAESADFITYWYPQMMKNESNHIRFLFNEECNVYGELNISPVPDHVYRVGMLWCEATGDFIPEEQSIPKAERTGFTVMEWGGTEVPNLFEKEN